MRGKRFLDAYISCNKNEQPSMSTSTENLKAAHDSSNSTFNVNDNNHNNRSSLLYAFMAGNRKSSGSITSQLNSNNKDKTNLNNQKNSYNAQQQRQKVSFVQDPYFLILAFLLVLNIFNARKAGKAM